AMMVQQAAGLAWLALAHGRLAILASVALFGLTMGNSLMMHPLLLVERFGTRDYGRIYAVSQLMTVAGVAACPAVVGLLYEASGGYGMPYIATALTTLVGFAVLAAWAGARRTEV